MFCNKPQSENTSSPIYVTLALMLTSEIALQLVKVLRPKLSTFFGIFIVCVKPFGSLFSSKVGLSLGS